MSLEAPRLAELASLDDAALLRELHPIGDGVPLHLAGPNGAGYGIKVYTIAMGSEGTVNVPEYVNFNGRIVKTGRFSQMVSTINPELLMKISDVTGGKFYRAADADSMRRIFADIDKLERSTSTVQTPDPPRQRTVTSTPTPGRGPWQPNYRPTRQPTLTKSWEIELTGCQQTAMLAEKNNEIHSLSKSGSAQHRHHL